MTREEAVRALLYEFHIADFVYHIRDRISKEEWDVLEKEGRISWDAPSVKRYSEAICTLERKYPQC